MNTCTIDACTRPIQGRGLCGPHYASWHRQQRKYNIRCAWCGATVNVGRPSMKYCNITCSNAAKQSTMTAAASAKRIADAFQFRQCGWCNALHTGKGKFCNRECRLQSSAAEALKQWSPLRRALAECNHDAVIDAIRSKSDESPAGCWLWPRLDRGGYPTVPVGKKTLAVHRLVVEAKHRCKLGSQAVHHTCATPACVNPDHLQPVTHAENIAEMLARKSFVARITELEAALAEYEPDHPLLHLIACA